MSAALAAFLAAGVIAAPAAAAANDAPKPYNAETTYQKLKEAYPFIRIASRDVPPGVRAIRDLTYASPAGRALQLDLFLPAAHDAGGERRLRPAVVFVHGGGWSNGVRENLMPMAIGMAVRGYAAATISYRLSGEAPYPAAIHDVKAAIRWLRTHAADYGIDGDRIAVGGGSAGGQIASLVGMTNGIAAFDPQAGSGAASSAAQAVINIDGLSDFTSAEARLHEDDPKKNPSAAGAWFGGNYAQKTSLWREASPTFHVGPASPPVLFIISAQPRFSVGRADMAAKLDALGIRNRTVQVPDTPHSFWLFEPWLAPTVAAAADFLDSVFAPGAAGRVGGARN